MPAGNLFIVATPIGNLGDVTMRALDVLRSVAVIYCEDTRETQKLLQHYNITGKKLLSYHAQSLHRREEEILEMLRRGNDCASVSDRGTPGISDPGARLIAAAVAEGIAVVPIPGASALLAALQGAGCDTSQFVFFGFLPHKKGRRTTLQKMIAERRTAICYESVHRIQRCLAELVANGIGTRRVIVARELTKLHEEFLRGTAEEVHAVLAQPEKLHGEFVVILDAKN